ncbi:MAG: hypothetical protein LBH34_06065, partial [Prevotellaceae bacterium]|nr:hypothetical protein [Prevotellaceae bacterium]
MSKFTPILQDTLIVKQDPSKIYGGMSYITQQKSGFDMGIGINRQNLAVFDFEFVLPFLLFLLLTIFTVGFRRSNIFRIFDSFFRFKRFISYQRNQILGQEKTRSSIMDADIAESTSKLAASTILQSAGISALVQAN